MLDSIIILGHICPDVQKERALGTLTRLHANVGM